MKARIRKIVVGVNRNRVQEVVYELGLESLVHLEAWDASSSEAASAAYADIESRVGSVLLRVEKIFDDLNIAAYPAAAGRNGPAVFSTDIDADSALLDSISDEIGSIRDLRAKYLAETESLLIRLDDAADAGALLGSAALAARMKLCRRAFGVVRDGADASGSGVTGEFYIRQSGRYVLGISLPGHADEMTGFLLKLGYEGREEMLSEYLSSPDAPGRIRMRETLEGMKRDLQKQEERFTARIDEIRGSLARIHAAYSALKSSIGAMKGFLQTGETRFINGWMDIDDLDRLVSALERTCGRDFFIRVFTGEETRRMRARAPVRLKNPRFFRAFEMIVRNAGIPGSSEIDPTPVAALAYLLMFGVMFGDIGQGLVLVIAGLAMRIIAARKKLRAFYRDGGTVLAAAGISAALFGVLYGSVFSNERLVPALWFHPMAHIMDLFFAAIMMGASFITLGIVMNVINLCRERKYFEAALGRRGMLGFVVYAGSVFLAVRFIAAGTAPRALELALVLGLPAGIFLARNVAAYLFQGAASLFPNGVFEYMVESLVELMEMFSGFLGSSVSFIRAGAFALSHAGLSIAVYTLAKIAGPPLSAGALVVIVTGNIFIILLEGLVCGIQSMRLEYYEFFSRFFRGDGVEFAPFSFMSGIKEKHVVARGVA